MESGSATRIAKSPNETASKHAAPFDAAHHKLKMRGSILDVGSQCNRLCNARPQRPCKIGSPGDLPSGISWTYDRQEGRPQTWIPLKGYTAVAKMLRASGKRLGPLACEHARCFVTAGSRMAAAPAVAENKPESSGGLLSWLFGSSRPLVPMTEPYPGVALPSESAIATTRPPTEQTTLSNGIRVASEATPVSRAYFTCSSSSQLSGVRFTGERSTYPLTLGVINPVKTFLTIALHLTGSLTWAFFFLLPTSAVSLLCGILYV